MRCRVLRDGQQSPSCLQLTREDLPTARDKRLHGVMLVLGSAVGYAIVPPLAKIAYEHGADSRGVLAMRFVIAAPLLTALVAGRRRGTVSLSALPAVAGAAILWLFSNWAFFESLARMSAVIVVLVFFSYPILVGIGGMLFLGEPLTGPSAALILLGSVGVYLSVGVAGKASGSGLGLAVFSALVFALFFLRAKHLLSTGRVDGIGFTAGITGVASIGFPVLLLAGGGSVPSDGAGWGAVLGLALAGTVLATVLLYSGLPYLDASTAAMLSTAEPPLAVLFTAVLIAEPVAPIQIVGMAVVLVAVLGLSRSATRPRQGIPPAP
jgi:drug/metabolite transporter (DMT)-like permease